MSVSLWVGDESAEVGTAGFFQAFFSTISYRLESKGWGSNYPVLMSKLYYGELPANDAGAALTELDDAASKLKDLITVLRNMLEKAQSKNTTLRIG